jgi:hypothetical protein
MAGLWAFESGVLRKILGRKRNEITGGRGRLYNEELYYRCSSPNITGVMQINKNETDGACETEEVHTGFWYGDFGKI